MSFLFAMFSNRPGRRSARAGRKSLSRPGWRNFHPQIELFEERRLLSVSPITISSPSLQFKEGKPFSGMVAQVTDTNNNVHVADVSATINWGDGSTSGGRIQRLHQHVFGVFGNHRYSEEGSHQVVVSATIAGVTASNSSGLVAANLVADIAALGPTTIDTNLVNGWGLAASPTGPFWVAGNGTGILGVYNSSGQSQLAVTIPTPSGSADPHASPTGVVFNSTSKAQSPAGLPEPPPSQRSTTRRLAWFTRGWPWG